MTEDEVAECRALALSIAEIERKLAYWNRQRSVCEQIAEMPVEKLSQCSLRQKALLEGKVKAAGN